MDTRDILFLVAIILVIAALYQNIYLCNRVENLDGLDSIVDVQQAAAHREKNQKLDQMCNQMFDRDMRFISECRSDVNGVRTYETGIHKAFEIYQQNKRDGIEWEPKIYLEILKGNTENIICFLRMDPILVLLCAGSTDRKRREMWVDYWKMRRQNSRDWRLAPAVLQL